LRKSPYSRFNPLWNRKLRKQREEQDKNEANTKLIKKVFSVQQIIEHPTLFISCLTGYLFVIGEQEFSYEMSLFGLPTTHFHPSPQESILSGFNIIHRSIFTNEMLWAWVFTLTIVGCLVVILETVNFPIIITRYVVVMKKVKHAHAQGVPKVIYVPLCIILFPFLFWSIRSITAHLELKSPSGIIWVIIMIIMLIFIPPQYAKRQFNSYLTVQKTKGFESIVEYKSGRKEVGDLLAVGEKVIALKIKDKTKIIPISGISTIEQPNRPYIEQALFPNLVDLYQSTSSKASNVDSPSTSQPIDNEVDPIVKPPFPSF